MFCDVYLLRFGTVFFCFFFECVDGRCVGVYGVSVKGASEFVVFVCVCVWSVCVCVCVCCLCVCVLCVCVCVCLCGVVVCFLCLWLCTPLAGVCVCRECYRVYRSPLLSGYIPRVWYNRHLLCVSASAFAPIYSVTL